MKWDGDIYRTLKWEIFDTVMDELLEHHAEKITLRKLSDAIDELIDKLTRSSNE